MINKKELDPKGTHLFHLSKHLLNTRLHNKDSIRFRGKQEIERERESVPGACPHRTPRLTGVEWEAVPVELRAQCQVLLRRKGLSAGSIGEALWRGGFLPGLRSF